MPACRRGLGLGLGLDEEGGEFFLFLLFFSLLLLKITLRVKWLISREAKSDPLTVHTEFPRLETCWGKGPRGNLDGLNPSRMGSTQDGLLSLGLLFWVGNVLCPPHQLILRVNYTSCMFITWQMLGRQWPGP